MTALPRYQRLKLLGTGGMAEVWTAKLRGPAGFERPVVVKRILPHRARDARFVSMFLSEARLSARLLHPNIVQVFELGEEANEYFMVMEYVRGHDLVEIVRALEPRGGIPVGLAALIVHDVSRALGYAHALTDDSGRPLGIVHRDVSPSNVMLSREGTVKLLDFGIAKASGAGEPDVRTETGALKGKFGYMSPEQVDGRPLDHRSDLFAAGILLHELLAGRRLFRGASEFETLAMVRAAAVAPPSQSNAAVSAALDAVCLRALARDPAQRYPSGDALADALEPHLDDWSSARARTLLATLFPDAADGADAVDGVAASEASAPSSVSAPMVTETGPAAGASTSAAAAAPQGARRARWPVPWLVTGLLAAGAALALLAVTTRAHAPARRFASAPASPASRPVTVAPSAEAPAATPPVATAPPAPRIVTLELQSEPPGADVHVGGDATTRGSTPLRLDVPASATALHLEMRKRDYLPEALTIVPDVARVVQVRLRPAAAPSSPARAAKPARAPAKSRPKAFDPDAALPL